MLPQPNQGSRYRLAPVRQVVPRFGFHQFPVVTLSQVRLTRCLGATSMEGVSVEKVLHAVLMTGPRLRGTCRQRVG